MVGSYPQIGDDIFKNVITILPIVHEFNKHSYVIRIQLFSKTYGIIIGIDVYRWMPSNLV